MTESAPANPAPAAPIPPAGTRRAPDPAPRRGGGGLALAILLALAAAGAAGYTAWTVWNMRQDLGAANGLKGQVDTLQTAVDGLRDDNANLRRRLSDADGVNRSAREEVLGMAERTKNLEDAVANLSERSLSGHDAMLLDEAESLLRMAKERFALFGDASGALSAYDLADKTLAGVNDSAFAAVRQNLTAEREALEAVQPRARANDLATLADLRAQIPTLPLKTIDSQAGADEERTFWQRAGNALGSIVRISHDEGTPLGLADDRLARELAALDVAHAEAAVLAYDDRARADALKRVDATLVAHFNVQAPSVQTARQRIATLLASQAKGGEPKLGAALEELRNLRSVHALKANAGTATASPAHAASAPAAAPAAASSAAKATP
ncbi:uroporphyrinogen-III C-methyltransferase [Luteibacter aegosomatissinici]|uniref:uroporphyrinogen-III C-methyltransferase n=1 Tax=Luteibacter aegosomatissinici TaxID=2911539 RepID=UPI001FFA1068|nr:uroporphyrinogen-III C-methyltransferase [Luteibacter aegosomatissinici]UPG95017.1 uroporphyrinogen-III C-methyltransferase [Luteibacter aegosomatissinici]